MTTAINGHVDEACVNVDCDLCAPGITQAEFERGEIFIDSIAMGADLPYPLVRCKRCAVRTMVVNGGEG